VLCRLAERGLACSAVIVLVICASIGAPVFQVALIETDARRDLGLLVVVQAASASVAVISRSRFIIIPGSASLSASLAVDNVHPEGDDGDMIFLAYEIALLLTIVFNCRW